MRVTGHSRIKACRYHRLSRYPHQLSGGQRQRVAIARALAVNPELILADEPISMLDVSIRMGILNLLAQLKEERGISYVYITHDLASARYISDKTMVMYAGHIVEGGDREEIMGNPAHPYTQLLLSAVPDPHAGLRTQKDIGARGEVPSLINPPAWLPVRSTLHPGKSHLPSGQARSDAD